MTVRAHLRNLYEGAGEAGDRFRYGLLAFDLATVSYLIASSFLPRGSINIGIDIAIGLVFLADLLARLLISRRPLSAGRVAERPWAGPEQETGPCAVW